MILNELFNANRAVDRLLNRISFYPHAPEMLLTPLDEVPEPERTIIFRSGRPDRFGIREPNMGVPISSKPKQAKTGNDNILRQIYPLLFSAP